MIAIRKLQDFIKKFPDYMEDILIFSGLLIIIMATFFISKIIGLYVLGGILVGLGVYFTRYPPRR